MEKPEISGVNLAACTVSIFISLVGIAGGAATFLCCESPSLAEVCGPAGAELA